MSDEEPKTVHEPATDELVEDIAAETVEGDVVDAGPGDLQQQLDEAQAKADEHWNQVLRIQADMENLRKRAKRDVENAHRFALEKFVSELLPVRDSLEMGLDAAASAGESAAKIHEGLDLTLKMLAGAMEKFGVIQHDPVGDRFDPQLHEAMTTQESAEHEPNTVLAVFQKGYSLNERLVRPAMVVVSKGGAAPAAEPPSIDIKA